jgi:hypothetical protein
MGCLLFGMFGVAGAAAAAGTPASLDVRLDVAGRLSVAADGQVSRVAMETPPTAALAPRVEPLLRSLRFAPLSAADAGGVDTRFSLELAAEPLPAGAGYRYTVANLTIGTPKHLAMDPPRYPARALANGVAARAVVLLRIGDDGRVQQAHVQQVSLAATGSEKTEAFYRNLFRLAILEAVPTWHFEPGQWRAGAPLGALACVPVSFFVSGNAKSVAWRAYVPGPVEPAPWTDRQCRHSILGADRDPPQPAGSFELLDDRLQLQTVVEGTTLP